jgi:hypothetical protein
MVGRLTTESNTRRMAQVEPKSLNISSSAYYIHDAVDGKFVAPAVALELAQSRQFAYAREPVAALVRPGWTLKAA